MIFITPNISIHENEIEEEFILSSGPGGQNVNKVATAVKLKFNIYASNSLPEDVKNRLLTLGGRRVTKKGSIIIHARRYASRERNRKDALNRLTELIKKASIKPKKRKKTKPSRKSIEQRLSDKKKRGAIKIKRKTLYQDN